MHDEKAAVSASERPVYPNHKNNQGMSVNTLRVISGGSEESSFGLKPGTQL